MPKEIEITRCEIIKGKIVETKHIEVIPDDKVRHCDWCTLCRFTTNYPECIKDCPNINEKDRKAGLELL